MTLNEDPKPTDVHPLVLVEDAQAALQQIINSIVADDRDYNFIMQAVEHYAATVESLNHHLVGERDGAIGDLSKLEQAIEDEDRDHPLVNQLYESAFDNGFEAGQEDAEMAGWNESPTDFDDGFDAGIDAGIESVKEEIKEALAIIMDCSEDEVEGLVDALSDYRAIINDEDVLQKLQQLAAKAKGDE